MQTDLWLCFDMTATQNRLPQESDFRLPHAKKKFIKYKQYIYWLVVEFDI